MRPCPWSVARPPRLGLPEADKVRGALKTIQKQRNMSVIYTSHNMPEVEQICDRILFIHQGKKITEGTPEQVIKNFNSLNLEQVFIKIVRSGDIVCPTP